MEHHLSAFRTWPRASLGAMALAVAAAACSDAGNSRRTGGTQGTSGGSGGAGGQSGMGGAGGGGGQGGSPTSNPPRLADGGSASPADGGSASPADGGSVSPADGGSASPADRGSASPADGGSASPADRGGFSPADGGSFSPADGGSVSPDLGPAQPFTPLPPAGTVAIDLVSLKDKIEGGWFGQMVGVSWGFPVEFKFNNQMVPTASIPKWNPDSINTDGYFSQAADDTYVEIPFMDAMKARGVNTSWVTFGQYFQNTTFRLWHANMVGRGNLKTMMAPQSGHYSGNDHADDIDWQIEADFVGQLSPGQVGAAIDIAWRAGHVMNFGDGVYGGVSVAAMHAAAFFAKTMDDIVSVGRDALPVGSEYRQVVDEVIAAHAAGKTFEENWTLLHQKWGTNDRCPDGRGAAFNIDAKVNGAHIFLGLLYGGGDFERSMELSMRAGDDADCNPSSVGAIIGNWKGYAALPDKFKSAFKRTPKFAGSAYNFDDVVALNIELARNVLLLNGGSISRSGATEAWHIPQRAWTAPILEQWPKAANTPPALTASVMSQTGNKVTFTASATDADGVKAYQWYFGDLSYADGAQVSHIYAKDGAYEVLCYVTDAAGNTSWKSLAVSVGGVPTEVFIEDTDPGWVWSGTWKSSISANAGGYHTTNGGWVCCPSAQRVWNGTELQIFGRAIAGMDIYVDDLTTPLARDVRTMGAALGLVWKSPKLPPGDHMVKVTAKGDYIELDFIKAVGGLR